MTGPEQHAATEAATGHLGRVLRALPEDSTDYGVLAARQSAQSLFSALVALAGRVDELTVAHDEAVATSSDLLKHCDRERAAREAAEARADELQREREQLIVARENAYERWGQARREADQLRAALEAVSGYQHPLGMSTRDSLDKVQEIARAALAGAQAEAGAFLGPTTIQTSNPFGTTRVQADNKDSA